jgi:hypothetical protein
MRCPAGVAVAALTDTRLSVSGSGPVLSVRWFSVRRWGVSHNHLAVDWISDTFSTVNRLRFSLDPSLQGEAHILGDTIDQLIDTSRHALTSVQLSIFDDADTLIRQREEGQIDRSEFDERIRALVMSHMGRETPG